MTRLKTTPFSVKLPDGTPLAYKGWTDGLRSPCPQRAWFRTDIRSEYLTENKKQAMVLSCWSARSTQRLVIADFDPKDRPHDFRDNLEDRLEELVRYSGGTAFTIPSISGNPKLVYVVECENMDDRLCEIFLREHLPRDLHWFDPRGTSRLYMGFRTIMCLRGELVDAVAMPWDPPRERIVLREADLSESVIGADNFAKIERIVEILGGGEKVRRVLRALFGTPRIWEVGGVAVPQRYMAECLDVSVGLVNRILHSLQALNHIRCVDHSFLKNVKAKSWKGGAIFFRVWQKLQTLPERISSARGKKRTRTLRDLPDSFTDGASYELLWTASNLFVSMDDFLAWAASLTGATRQRMNVARRVYASYERNRHRKPWLPEPILSFT